MQPSTQSTARLVILGGKELDAAAIAAQRASRHARVRMARVLLALLAIGLPALFLMSFWVGRHTTGETGLAFFLLLVALLFIIVFFANNVWQWRILQALDLRCPHCAQPLGVDIHWTKRPGYACPHCGNDAIATARQLGEV